MEDSTTRYRVVLTKRKLFICYIYKFYSEYVSNFDNGMELPRIKRPTHKVLLNAALQSYAHRPNVGASLWASIASLMLGSKCRVKLNRLLDPDTSNAFPV